MIDWDILENVPLAKHCCRLMADGYRVYHDVPAEEKGAKVNIDHVVVGPTGLFAIERNRRKGRARLGSKRTRSSMMDGSLSGLGPKMTSTFGRQNLVLAGFLNRSTKSMGSVSQHSPCWHCPVGMLCRRELAQLPC